jgi:predicted DsbA family dithiol-disulfide isomerase
LKVKEVTYYGQEVKTIIAMAQQIGVQGVPFVFDNNTLFLGAAACRDPC